MIASRGWRLGKQTRGFTLVELMVAVTGGLFVGMAVFVLAKQSSGLYQSETRAGNATFGNIVGFERLSADVARAGFLSTPNIRTDPAVCGDPATNGTWPLWLRRLASVHINLLPAGPTVPQVLFDNGRAPEEIVLSGSYVSSEQFATNQIVLGANGDEVHLNPNSPAMARLGTTNANARLAMLRNIFGAGRALRVVDTTGREQYGTIRSVDNAAAPVITLVQDRPKLLYRGDGNALRCGINGLGVGSLVNVVNIVKYALRAVSGNAAYAPLIGTTPGPAPGDAQRTELIRVELDTDGNEIPGTLEVVAEYAVDLKFGVTVATTALPTPGGMDQTVLQTFPFGDAQVLTWAGDPTSVANLPQRIRAVRARLSVRSREADRSADIATAADGGANIAPGFYRMGVGPGGGPPFARVRTVQADIALRNQMGAI